MARNQKSPWPYGNPTTLCPRCNGSGMNRAEHDRVVEGRAPTTKLGHRLACSFCEGRGRVITGTPDTCGHGLVKTDCAL